VLLGLGELVGDGRPLLSIVSRRGRDEYSEISRMVNTYQGRFLPSEMPFWWRGDEMEL
jgi:hypothetical protein